MQGAGKAALGHCLAAGTCLACISVCSRWFACNPYLPEIADRKFYILSPVLPGWGPGPADYAHATQAAAEEVEEWEAVPPGSEWDTSPGLDAHHAVHSYGSSHAAHGYSASQAVDSYSLSQVVHSYRPRPAVHTYGSSQAVDSYGWPAEPEYQPQANSYGWGEASGTSTVGPAQSQAGSYGWGEEGGSSSAAAEAAPVYQPEIVSYTPAPVAAQEASFHHLPPHLLARQAQQAAGGGAALPAAVAHSAAALSPFAAEYYPSGAPATQPARGYAAPAHAAPTAQRAPAHSAPAPQAPPLPHPAGGPPAYQHPAVPVAPPLLLHPAAGISAHQNPAPAAAAAPQLPAQPVRAKYRPRLPYQDSEEEEVVGDLMSALGI